MLNAVHDETCPIPGCGEVIDRSAAEGLRSLAECPACGTRLQWTGHAWMQPPEDRMGRA